MADRKAKSHKVAAEARAWEEHNLSQLRHFQSLSLRAKMKAVQGMADVVRRLQQMRANGELKPATGRRASGSR